MEPKVSVLCLTYNHEKYIRQCLDGFIMQKTNFPFEVIVHDDASKDNTAEIIREYEEKYPDIIKPIYETENQYSKKGFEIISSIMFPKAKGKYLAFCEGDDFWVDPLKLQKQYDLLESNYKYIACYSANYRVDSITGKVLSVHKILKKSSKIPIKYVFVNPQPHISTCMLRTNYYAVMPKFCFRANVGDLTLFTWLAVNGDVFWFEDVFSCYRVFVPNSWSSQIVCDNKLSELHNKKMIEYFNDLDDFTLKKYHKYIVSKIDMYDIPNRIKNGDFIGLIKNRCFRMAITKQKIAWIIQTVAPKWWARYKKQNASVE